MTTTDNSALRLAAVSDIAPRPRRGLTPVALIDADVILGDMLGVYAEFAVILRENFAVSHAGIVHLLPANRGRANG